jgi:hypothetical protein
MIWWSLIVVCYAANLRDTTLSMEELKAAATSPIAITAVTLNKGTITLNVDTNDLVETLKTKLESVTGTPPDQQRVLFGRKTLEEGNTLGFYDIKNGSQLQVALRLRY